MHYYYHIYSVFMLLQHMYLSGVCYITTLYTNFMFVSACALFIPLCIAKWTFYRNTNVLPRFHSHREMDLSCHIYTNTRHIAIQLTEWDQTDFSECTFVLHSALSRLPQIMFIVFADATHNHAVKSKWIFGLLHKL